MIHLALYLLLAESVPLGFFPGGAAKELEAERLLLSIPSPEGFGAHILYLTEEPHPAGSKRNMELADYVRDRFLEYGLEEVIYAPQPTYRDEVLPRIWEAIDAGAWDEIEGYERELVAAFERAGSLLDEAAAVLDTL